MAYKNVFFHKMLVYKRMLKKNKRRADSLVRKYLDIDETNEKIAEIIKNNLNNNCISLDSNDTVEFLNVTDEYIYAKIGRMKDILSVQLRHKETLIPTPITKEDKQELEIFTYFLIDRSNYVISYIREQAAPSIQKLTNLIDNVYGEDQHIFAEISSVTVDDAIPLLKNKDIIGTIDYTIAVPQDQIISNDKLGLSEKQFELLSNQKSAEIRVKLVAERNKSLIDDKKQIGKFLKELIGITPKVSVKAKNNNEYMQGYNILDNIFAKKEKFDFGGINKKDIVTDIKVVEEEIEKKLRAVYERNKEEILEYIK